MLWTEGRHTVTLLAMASIFCWIGVSPGQGQDKPQDRPTANAAGPQKNGGAQPADKLLRGVVAKVGDPFKEGLKVQCAVDAFCYPMLLLFDKDTTILFKNGKKATVADLKPGRWVSFKPKENLEPMGILRARVERVVLDPPDESEAAGKFPHNSLAVSRDRKLIAAVGTTYGVAPPIIRVVLVSGETGKVVRELECDTTPINKLVFSPDGKWLYGGVDPFLSGDHFYHGNGQLFVWDAATGKRVQELTAGIWALSPDGKHLAIGTNFVDIDPFAELPPRKPLPPTFAAGVLDTTTWKQVARLGEENAGLRALCFSPDGKTLALSVKPYDIRLWDWQAGKDRRRIVATKWKAATTKLWGDGWVPYLEFSPDGSLLASMTDVLPDYHEAPRKIDLWDPSTGKLVRSLEVGQHRPLYLTFTPKGDQIALIADQVKFRLIDIISGKTTKEFRGRVGVWLGLAPALYRHGLVPEQAPKAAPVFQQLWDLAGGAGIEAGKSP